MEMKKVIVADIVRTPWGKPGGSMEKLLSSDLAAATLKALLARTGVEPDKVDQVVYGQAHPSTYPNNIGHYGWLKAELPVEVPGYTVQSVSASALQALRNAYYLIATGNDGIVIAGGADSYSAAPFVMRDVRNHFYPEHRIVVDSLEEAERCTQPAPMSRLERYKLAFGGELSEEAAELAKQSIARAADAAELLSGSIVPVSYVVRKKGEVTVDKDEWVGAPQSVDEPLSPCADGAAVAMLVSEERASELGLSALAEIQGFAVAACAPEQAHKSGAEAVKKLLKAKGMTIDDVAVIEIMENSAADVLYTVKELGGSPRVNPLGGALGFGKNDGAEGLAMLMRAIAAMQPGEKGVLCVYSAGGQAMAALVAKR